MYYTYSYRFDFTNKMANEVSTARINYNGDGSSLDTISFRLYNIPKVLGMLKGTTFV